MPVFPEDRFVDAIVQTIKANAAYVPPYGSGATLYVRPYMMGTNPVIGVKPADEYHVPCIHYTCRTILQRRR